MGSKPLFQPGDVVLINGDEATIRTWPADNVGPYYATHNAPAWYGAGISGIAKPLVFERAGGKDRDVVHEEARIILVRRAAAKVVSTLGTIDDLDLSDPAEEEDYKFDDCDTDCDEED